jgi:hypothetical protein
MASRPRLVPPTPHRGHPGQKAAGEIKADAMLAKAGPCTTTSELKMPEYFIEDRTGLTSTRT